MIPLYALGIASLGIIVADVLVIQQTLVERATPEPPRPAAMTSAAPPPAQRESAAAQREDPGELPPPEPPPLRPRNDRSKNRKTQTVEQAVSTTCSTSAVDGLSRQIVTEARCADPQMFAMVPRRKNLVTPGNVFLFLEVPARDQLLQVLDANPNRTMTVNSAFRTVAQQFLLDRWARSGRCGIKMAATPGTSNHETGLALDVSEPGTWRAALEARGFRWMGPSDPVHFDYQGPGAVRREGIDIIAFQRLWNRNHPEDRIPENGAYSEQVEARIKKSPAAGFPQGAVCAASSARPASKPR
jgi:hypothetical protein